MSPETFARVLKVEANFDINKDDELLSLRYAVEMIQNKYDFANDGRIGPATSLLFAALAIRIDNDAVSTELKNFHSQKVSTLEPYLFTAIFSYDRRRLREIFLNDTDPLHAPMSKVASIIRIPPQYQIENDY